jgi:hypothetical protein
MKKGAAPPAPSVTATESKGETVTRVSVAQAAKDREGVRGRVLRGVRLHEERGREIVHYPTTGEYGVPSATEEGVLYLVSLEGEGSCDCPWFRFTGGVCKHIYAAAVFEAKRRGASGPPRRTSPRSRRCRSGLKVAA